MVALLKKCQYWPKYVPGSESLHTLTTKMWEMSTQSRVQWMEYHFISRLHYDANVLLWNDSEDGSNQEAALHSGGGQKSARVSISRDCA